MRTISSAVYTELETASSAVRGSRINRTTRLLDNLGSMQRDMQSIVLSQFKACIEHVGAHETLRVAFVGICSTCFNRCSNSYSIFQRAVLTLQFRLCWFSRVPASSSQTIQNIPRPACLNLKRLELRVYLADPDMRWGTKATGDGNSSCAMRIMSHATREIFPAIAWPLGTQRASGIQLESKPGEGVTAVARVGAVLLFSLRHA